jgi:hypothetical protein
MGDALAALAEGDLGLAKSILDDMLETVESFPEEIDLTFNIHTNGTIPGGVSGIPIGAQGGFHGMVTQPTLFLAGEGGQPEYVNVTPMSQVTPAQSMSAGPGLVIENLHLSLPNVTNGRDFYDELVRELNRRRKLAAVAGIHVAGKF